MIKKAFMATELTERKAEEEKLAIVQSELKIDEYLEDGNVSYIDKLERIFSKNGIKAGVVQDEENENLYIITFAKTNDIFYWHVDTGEIEYIMLK